VADQATEKISVAAPPERCFTVAADLERYPEWAADIKEVTIDERDVLIDMPWGPQVSQHRAFIHGPTPGLKLMAPGGTVYQLYDLSKDEAEANDLAHQDRAVLDQVATCVTTGPLKGRSLDLVGHADPRGEAEFNLVLGDKRARSAWKYLADRGVDKGKLAETSRGELDASGTDETGWERDRRVDIVLK